MSFIKKLFFSESKTISNKGNELIRCLNICWGIDKHTTLYVKKYFQKFINNQQFHYILDDFITLSYDLNLQFNLNKELHALSLQDGVIQATSLHPVIFENPFIRILAGIANPGEREAFHIHSWKNVLVLFEEGNYLIEYANASSKNLLLSPGVYIFPPEELHASTNMGLKQENSLRFEIKPMIGVKM